MLRPIRLGRVLGFDVVLSPSLFLLLGLVFLFTGGAVGLAVVVAAFASVLAHELGHALVARHLDVRVAGIELNFFGGAARMIDSPRTPRVEIAIAAAGPAVSFAIGGLALLGASATGFGVLSIVGWINLVIGGFNLLPALPMDGGRILRATLARRMSFDRATGISVTVARWLAGGLGLIALSQGAIYLALLAVMIWFMAGRERFLAAVGATRYRDESEVEVLPRGFPTARVRTRDGARVVVVREPGGRFVVDLAD